MFPTLLLLLLLSVFYSFLTFRKNSYLKGLAVNPNFEIVDYKEFEKIEEEANELLLDSSSSSVDDDEDKAHQIWCRLNDAMFATAERFGKVGSSGDENLDFYHRLDWFHRNVDGFALQSKKCISVQSLLAFQGVAKKHHEDTCIKLDGGIFTPTFRLMILITTKRIVLSWYGCDKITCITNIAKLKLKLLS